MLIGWAGGYLLGFQIRCGLFLGSGFNDLSNPDQLRGAVAVTAFHNRRPDKTTHTQRKMSFTTIEGEII